ncbi:MAG TPA: fumarylacetoacetase [Candidatus Stackebrandtia excrementipullorum]|nr:fumarylacetoacetase [Candidatus Stackebrandtia excrementipullorum]
MSWVDGAADSLYSIHHLPYGVFSTAEDASPRIGVRIGDFVLDVRLLVAGGTCPGCQTCSALSAGNLNPLLAAGGEVWAKVRSRLQDALTNTDLKSSVEQFLTPVSDVSMHLPFAPGDYVDFYSSEHHAVNVGKIFRPDGDPLMPNWKHLPVGYHGRSGTIIPSGTDIIRPCGQRRGPEGDIVFGPSTRLDIEAEVGFVVGAPSRQGASVSPDAFTEHVFGVVLVNDWSARDIQAWEYQPLGPFLGKSFATSIGTWVTPLEALAASRVAAPVQDPAVLSYLKESDRYAYDLSLSVRWNGTEVSRPPFANMYWSPAQQLAHMTVNGASVRPGDLFASGTVSGPETNQYGSFLELTWGGSEPVTLDDGAIRTFLVDGDTVTISATAPGPRGVTIGLGEVTGRIQPAVG